MRGSTLTRALPQKVAPKKTQKGVRKWPQQMPHRSNSALGQAASRKMPQNPFLRRRQPDGEAVGASRSGRLILGLVVSKKLPVQDVQGALCRVLGQNVSQKMPGTLFLCRPASYGSQVAWRCRALA